MFAILALLFFGVPLAELAVIITVGSRIGVPETLALLVVISLVGAWLAKHQGLGVWRRIQAELQMGRVPGNELVDGLLILIGAVLLLTPGFLTDAIALGLLLPPVRAVLRRVVRQRFERRVDVTYVGPPPTDPPITRS